MAELTLTNAEIRKLNEFVPYLDGFKPTWEFQRVRTLANRTIAWFTGNQYGKTGGSAHGYNSRLFGAHPVPKRNLFYFECEKRGQHDLAPHGHYWFKWPESDRPIKGWEKGTWNVLTRPGGNVCPYCGGKIVIHYRQSRIFRFAGESLPTDKGSTGGQSKEIKSSIYPALKKWLPQFIITRDKFGKPQDITFRVSSIALCDIWDGAVFGGIKYKGDDAVWEFVSYNQTVQSGAGVQRVSLLTDEESDEDFDEEQMPRLLAEDGDKVYTLTPAMRMTWTFDAIHEQASMIVRTKAVCEFLEKSEGKPHPQISFAKSGQDIVVIQCATDDNPTLSPEVIEEMFAIPDPDGTIIPTRRYGVFKQATGRIFKDMDYSIHVIKPQEYLITDDVLDGWTEARAIDFHESNPWAIIWAAISGRDELFITREFNPSPEKMVTAKICNEIARLSGMHKYTLNLIDPLAAKNQPKTGKTSVEDINDNFYRLKHGKPIASLSDQHQCSGGFWETWKTQGLVGRDAIKERLANSIKCKTPFNNKRVVKGLEKYLPTIWIFDRCPETARSLKHWRLDAWKDRSASVNKDRKETPSQKFSHFPTAIEGLLKDKRFRAGAGGGKHKARNHGYFKGAA